MESRKLPQDFFFGAAMSGPQTEGAHNKGGKLPNFWDRWSDLEINKFHNNVGSYVGNDFYNKYEEDIKILKSLNFNSFRTSIQWSRFLDKDGNNKEGILRTSVVTNITETDVEVIVETINSVYYLEK